MEKGLLTEVSDFVLKYRLPISAIAGTIICYPIFRDIYQTNEILKNLPVFEQLKYHYEHLNQGLSNTLRIAKNYLGLYILLDLVNYFGYSENIDRLYNSLGLNRKRKYLQKSISANKEPTYYLKLALLDFKEGNEKSCIKNLNEAFELHEPEREADYLSPIAWLFGRINNFFYGSKHFLSDFLYECNKIKKKKSSSDLEKIVSAAGFAINGYEQTAKEILEEVEQDNESTILLKSQIYNHCFRQYKNLAGKELGKIVEENKLIPFSDRPRNSLFILDVDDASLKNKILVKTNKYKGDVEKEYELTSIFYYFSGDLIPRPFGLVRKIKKKYLLMRNIEGESFQKYFEKNKVEVEELEKIIDSIAGYQHLAEIFKHPRYRGHIAKYGLKFNFFDWFCEKAIDRMNKYSKKKLLGSEIYTWAYMVNDLVKIYLKHAVGMHGDFTIDNLLRRNDGQVTIIDSERFKLGLGVFDVFNILEDTRLDLDEKHKKYLFDRYVEKQPYRLGRSLKNIFRNITTKELFQRQYNTLFYPKQLATAAMFYEYFLMTKKSEFEGKIRHHLERLKIDLKPISTCILRLRDASLRYLLMSPLKEYLLDT